MQTPSRSTDVDPAAGADQAYPRIGQNWQRPPPQPGAFFNTEPPAEFEDPAETKRMFRLTASIIALALVVAASFIILTIMEAGR